MPLSPYALVTLDDLKTKLTIVGDGMNALLEQVINRASSDIETHLDRQLISRGSLVEFHNPVPNMCELYPGEWPLGTVSEICEDTSSPHTYAASTVLAVDVDYEIVKAPASFLRRIYSGVTWYWWPGRRTVRLTYTAGYTLVVATPQVMPLLPDHIRGAALELCALYYAIDERKKHGISGATDATGNWTRFNPAELSDDMKERLSSSRRELFPGTWERAS